MAIIVLAAWVGAVWAAEPLPVTILHTNDHHGHTLSYSIKSRTVGGLAQRIQLFDEIRQEVDQQNGWVLILDAGDVTTGTLFSDSFSAEPDWAVYSRTYDAVVPGNHEFDIPFSRLTEFASRYKIPFLCANLISRAKQKPVYEPFRVFKKSGHTIGVIGLTNPDTPVISLYGNDRQLLFRPPISAIQDIVLRLRPRVEVLVALSHLGLTADQRLAQTIPDFDLIIGGHSHDVLRQPMRVGSTIIVQAGSRGKYVGRLDFNLDPKQRRSGITYTQYQLIPIFSNQPRSSAVMTLLKPFIDTFGERGQTVVGEAAADFSRKPLAGPNSSSAMAHLIADSYREALRADIAFVNRGGVRGDFQRGRLTEADLHRVFPFDNTLYLYRITGDELLQLINDMVAKRAERQALSPGALLFPSNLHIIAGSQLRVRFFDNTPLAKNRLYLVAVDSFIAGGGDGFQMFSQLGNVERSSIKSIDAIRTYIKRNSPIVPDRRPRLVWQ